MVGVKGIRGGVVKGVGVVGVKEWRWWGQRVEVHGDQGMGWWDQGGGGVKGWGGQEGGGGQGLGMLGR